METGMTRNEITERLDAIEVQRLSEAEYVQQRNELVMDVVLSKVH